MLKLLPITDQLTTTWSSSSRCLVSPNVLVDPRARNQRRTALRHVPARFQISLAMMATQVPITLVSPQLDWTHSRNWSIYFGWELGLGRL